MKIVLDLNTIEGYKQFLAVKSLPIYSFTGREAEFADEYASRLGLTPPNPVTREYTHKPWLFDYQRDISRIAIRRKKFAAFVACGLGKTVISGEYARYLLDYLPKDKQILMVSPSMVVQQTIDEFSKFYGMDLLCERVRAKDLGNWLQNGGKCRFGITNYEAISDKITSIGKVACLILDESSLLKSSYGRWGTRELIFSPFAGIGSEGVVSLLNHRRFYGCELKKEYFEGALKNLAVAERKSKVEKQSGLFESEPDELSEDLNPNDSPHDTYKICPMCNGNKEYSVNSGGPDGEEYVHCDNCDGTGQIKDDQESENLVENP